MKTFLLFMIVVLGWLPLSRAWSPSGPVGNGGDAWQGPSTGFGPARDVVAPKNLGEEYRRNVPVLYYACDANFLDYFGTSGQQAVDSAFAALNLAFTNSPTGQQTGLDGYSASLSEFPLQSRHLNYQAQAFGLYDVKTEIMTTMMDQFGLADPTLYVYGIHNWDHVGTIPCPVGQEYDVVMRNFDYVSSPLHATQYNQYQYSPYINNVLYTYSIIELCAAPPTPWRWAQPATVDPLADAFTPLAAHVIDYGAYTKGLTRDDAAGLRHLMSAQNIKWETIAPDAVVNLITTNTSASAPFTFPPLLTSATNFVVGTNGGYYVFTGTTNSFIGYGDLVAFWAFVKTNSPAAVQAAYPGVVISSVSYTGMVVQIPNIISYFTNPPYGSPVGTPPALVIVTNYISSFQVLYNYTFANIFTNHYAATPQLLESVTVGRPIGAPVGSPGVTNTVVTTLPGFSGDFFVLPLFQTYTNVCPLDILPWGTITNVLAITNGIGLAFTNSTSTNLQSVVFTVSFFTNYSYEMLPVNCTPVAGATGLYEGVEKVQFIGTSYDSLLGLFYNPITNYYTMNYVTNGQVQVQYLERVVTRPDFVVSAQDLTPGPNSVIFQVVDQVTATPFVTANVPAGLAGPGTIEVPPVLPETISLNKDGPTFFNSFATTLNGNSYFVQPGLDQLGQPAFDDYYAFYFLWATYDGTTNAPIIYPSGTSIDNLQNQILVNVSPATVPGGTNGVAYTPVQFTATSTYFATPFTWSASGGLPPGLSLTSNADNTATLSGTPTQSGSFTFTLTLTDNLSRTVQWNYLITIQ